MANVNFFNSTGGEGSGKAATIEVGTVTTVEPTEPATVTNVGTAQNAVFNFKIPKGVDGVIGADGESAYDIAVRNGFEGTEQEWLSSITTIAIRPYEAWEDWLSFDPDNNTLSFEEWIDAKLRLGDDEISRVRARLEWEAAAPDTEYWTGEYHADGKKIYGKNITFGALPNTAAKNVAHNITKLNRVEKVSGIAYSTAAFLPLPFMATGAAVIRLAVDNSTNNIVIETGSNRSSFSAVITLLYTCTDR